MRSCSWWVPWAKPSKVRTTIHNAANKEVEEFFDQLEKLQPVLEKAGFMFDNVTVKVAVMPCVSAKILNKEEKMDEEALEDVSVEKLLNNTGKSILIALRMAHSTRMYFRESSVQVASFTMEIGIPPALDVCFEKRKTRTSEPTSVLSQIGEETV